MPPPASRIQRPAVKKPALQKGSTVGYTSLTSTDTWNKPTSNLEISAPSTKSTIPGVELRKGNAGVQSKPSQGANGITPKAPSVGSGRRPAPKPLPGAKLRPLRANDRDNDRNANTWDPKNRPNISKKSTVSLKATKAKLNSPNPAVTPSGSEIGKASPSSRSSSVASVKPVLPDIKKIQDPEPAAVASSKKRASEEATEASASASALKDLRPRTSRNREIAAAKVRKAVAEETKQADQYTDYYIPEWYTNPLIKPAVLKGGITVFCTAIPPLLQLHSHSEPVNYLFLQSMRHLKDVQQFMAEHINNTLLTLTYLKPTDADEENLRYIPPSLSKELALKANSLTSTPYYRESTHDPEVYHLKSPYKNPEEEDLTKICENVDFVEYCTGIAESLGVKAVTTLEEVDAMIVKSIKRHVNVQKQERALHPHIYIQPFESEDIWNHVSLSHKLSESCFRRQGLLDEVKAAIMSDLRGVSSPIIISGSKKVGKSWLCAQIPSLMGEEALTLVRFCGLTRLTNTLPKVLRGLSKQLHITCHSFILPRTIEQLGMKVVSDLFTDVLKEASESSERPVVLVLDAFDKLAASCEDLSQFVALCKDSVPANVALVISTTCEEGDDSEFYDSSRNSKNDVARKTEIQILNKYKDVNLDDYDEYGWIESSLETLSEEDSLFALVGLDAAALTNAVKEFAERNAETDVSSLSSLLELKKKNYEFLTETLQRIANVKTDFSDVDDDDKRTALASFRERQEASKETLRIMEKKRSDTVNRIDEYIRMLDELYPDNQAEVDNLGQLGSSPLSANGQRHIKVSNFSTEESIEYIKYLSCGKLDDAECEKLTEISAHVHNPLHLRLIVNRCSLSVPANRITTLFDNILGSTDSREEFYKKVAYDPNIKNKDEDQPEDEEIELSSEPHGLVHLLTAILVFNESISNGDNTKLAEIMSSLSHDECVQTFMHDLSGLRLSDAERMLVFAQHRDEVGGRDYKETVSDVIYYLNQALHRCELTVYEQNEYVHDVEQVECLLRSELYQPYCKRLVSKQFYSEYDTKRIVAKLMKEVFRWYQSLTMYSYFSLEEGSNSPAQLVIEAQAIMRVITKSLTEERGGNFQWREFVEEILRHLFRSESEDKTPHESDTWQEAPIIILSENQSASKAAVNEAAEAQNNADTDDAEKDKDVDKPSRAPVTSAREKSYPLGRKKVMALQLIETFVARNVYMEDEKQKFSDANSIMVEVMLLYDFLVPLLHDFGVDYVTNTYGKILEIITNTMEIHGEVMQNVKSLEMLYNLLVIYTLELRENPNNFYTLFLSMFDEDSSLTSRAASRLYRRVMHEVNVRNNLHVITMLSKTMDLALLSIDTKRYLLNTSNKYAATECISNASYILSHNKSRQVKLWELTGEFISVQTFHGRIVCVCPQRTNQCFLAVIECVSEVGQKSASVWRIDRLTNKKLADVGSKIILSAWFDKLGEKLVMVEQQSADELRVVVCIPQTMELKLEENTIRIAPHHQSSFMDKCLGIPTKVDNELLEIMTKHLTDDKKDADPTELSLFKPIAGKDGYALDSVVTKYPLILSSLEALWDDLLEKFDAKDDIVYPMEEIYSEVLQTKESVYKMEITLHGMTSAGDIVVDCQFSDGTHNVLLYKFSGNSISLNNELSMDDQATMTLMPTDDFVYSDTGSNSGLTSWNLPTKDKKVFGNDKNMHVTCLQFEVEEGQILSFTRGQVTVWNALLKTTESSFTLDKTADVVAACLQDNWLAIANREGELTIRFDIRKKMATYHFHEPIDWIDCHVIGDYLYVACHLNGEKPTICFLKYRVSDAPLYEREKYVVRPSTLTQH